MTGTEISSNAKERYRLKKQISIVQAMVAVLILLVGFDIYLQISRKSVVTMVSAPMATVQPVVQVIPSPQPTTIVYRTYHITKNYYTMVKESPIPQAEPTLMPEMPEPTATTESL